MFTSELKNDDATVADVSPAVRPKGVSATIRSRYIAWASNRSDLACVITQRGLVTALRFRSPRRGIAGAGKVFPLLTPVQLAEIRTFASELSRELSLKTNMCSVKCVNGYFWFVLTFQE